MSREAYIRTNGIERTINYAHSSAVSAGEIIYLDGIGAIVAQDAYAANEEGAWLRFARVSVPITSGVSIAQGEDVYWDVSANKALKANSTVLDAGDFYLGRAPSAGTASGGKVEVDLNLDVMSFGKGFKTITEAAATLTEEDSNIIIDATSNVVTITLPAVASHIGKEYMFVAKNVDNTVTIDGNSTELIEDAQTYVMEEAYEVIKIKSDGSKWYITAKYGNIEATKIEADAIGNGQIADDAVSLEHLDSGITPTHIIIASGSHTTAGGDTAESITVTDMLSTDKAIVIMESTGANAALVAAAIAADGSISVTMTCDPSTDHKLAYIGVRAAS